MTTATYDAETLERIARIKANPNPRSFAGLIRRFIAWGKNLNRPIAFQAAKTMFAIIGATGYAGYLSGMNFVLGLFSLSLVAGTWYSVYLFLMQRKQS
jgi:hypothetical protein